MDRALWMLLWLRLWGWARRLVRGARTVRGALFLIVGVLVFGSLGLNALLSQVLTVRPPATAYQPTLVRFGPAALFGYTLLSVLFASSERAVPFSPAEVNFLFPGPFSRRQLLLYKVVGTFFTSLLTALLLTVFLLPYAVWALAAFVGLALGLLFTQLLAMAVALVAGTIGARANTWWRKLVLLFVLIVVLLALAQAGKNALQQEPQVLLESLEQTPAVRVILEPFRWFILTFTADRLWPDLVRWAALSLAVNAVLLGIVFLLDAQYLESAAAASERLYARMQRMREGGLMVGAVGHGKPRFSLPSLPWWGGAGPIAWRQLTTGMRNLRALLIFLAVMGSILVLPAVLGARGGARNLLPAGHVVALSLGMMTILVLPQMLTFDFRGDLDRMEVLKTLPIRPFWLAIGQLTGPVVLLTAVQGVLVAIIQLFWGGIGGHLPVFAAFAIPINVLAVGIENLLFLWFPSRVTPAAPGDVQQMGRHLLIALAKFMVLGVGAGLATLAGGLAYLIAGWVAALAAAWAVLASLAIALAPLIALAFRQFDVARDMPP